MAMYRNVHKTTPVRDINTAERDMEILELENAREEINKEIEYLLDSYKKLTKNRKATKGAKKIGKQQKDYSYWHGMDD